MSLNQRILYFQDNQVFRIRRASTKSEERQPRLTNLYISNKHLSKNHATIAYKNKAFYIEDQCSTFGTLLNGKVLIPHRSYPLKDKDEIGLIISKPSEFIKKIRDSYNCEPIIELDRFIQDKLLPSIKLTLQINIVGNILRVHLLKKDELHEEKEPSSKCSIIPTNTAEIESVTTSIQEKSNKVCPHKSSDSTIEENEPISIASSTDVPESCTYCRNLDSSNNEIIQINVPDTLDSTETCIVPSEGDSEVYELEEEEDERCTIYSLSSDSIEETKSIKDDDDDEEEELVYDSDLIEEDDETEDSYYDKKISKELCNYHCCYFPELDDKDKTKVYDRNQKEIEDDHYSINEKEIRENRCLYNEYDENYKRWKRHFDLNLAILERFQNCESQDSISNEEDSCHRSDEEDYTESTLLESEVKPSSEDLLNEFRSCNDKFDCSSSKEDMLSNSINEDSEISIDEESTEGNLFLSDYFYEEDEEDSDESVTRSCPTVSHITIASLKRKFDQMDEEMSTSDEAKDSSVELPPRKKVAIAESRFKMIAKEAGKGIFYVLATIAALGIYGSTLSQD